MFGNVTALAAWDPHNLPRAGVDAASDEAGARDE